MRSCSMVLVALVLAATATAARADSRSDGAREHFDRGTTLFDLRRYREAAHEYEAAYELVERAELLFNIAQSYRYAGDYEAAVASYRAFLRRAPNAEDRREVEARIHEMVELLAAQRKTRESPPPGTLSPTGHESPNASGVRRPGAPAANGRPTATASSTAQPAALAAPATADATPARRPGVGRSSKIAGLTIGAVGVAALGVGIGFAGLARSTSDQVARAPVFDPAVDQRGHLYQGLETGLIVGGAAAVVAGTVLYAVGRRQSKRARAFVVCPTMGPGRVGLEVRY